jgi:hypothetical protein
VSRHRSWVDAVRTAALYAHLQERKLRAAKVASRDEMKMLQLTDVKKDRRNTFDLGHAAAVLA